MEVTEDGINIGSYTPSYKMIGESKIPVSKNEGKLWKERLEKASELMKKYSTVWKNNIKFFNDSEISTNKKVLENLIWSNTVGLLPELFAQVPQITIQNNKRNNELTDEVSNCLETLINAIMNDEVEPSINIKEKGKRCVLTSLLTNRACLKIGYTKKEDGNEQALNEYSEITKELQEAKETKDIQELEGKLKALDDMIGLIQDSGAFSKVVSPFNIFVDYNSKECDASDASWLIERDLMPKDFLKAKFGYKDDDGITKSIYSDKDLKMTTADVQELNRLVCYEEVNKENKDLTIVWWIWDKIKRRVCLYANDCWEYPIWVWDDPYKLDRFFPYYFLSFYISPEESFGFGEVEYYRQAQNEINKINDQVINIRNRTFNKVVFNSTYVTAEDAQKIVNGNSDLIGLPLPPDISISNIIAPLPTPSAEMLQLFDKNDLNGIINKLATADATTRGEEYKTNTTNIAIGDYQQSRNIKIGDKRDIIEEWIGKICWGIIQLCMQFMDKEEVIEIIGEERGSFFQNVSDAKMIKRFLSVKIIGETTIKPTSSVKKQQALSVGQILGQFASATPYVAVIMLQVLQRAFDDVVISTEDWQQIQTSIQQQAQMQQMQIMGQQQQIQNNNMTEQDVVSQINPK